jgi:long-chain fatty acid transport protein
MMIVWRRHSGRRLAVVLAALLSAPVAQAGGFYLSEIGTPGSLGTAGVANSTNTFGADSSWANPAGMTGLDQFTIFAGLQIVAPIQEFDPAVATKGGDDGGNAGETGAIPSFFLVKPLSENTRFGFSLVAPFGGGIDYGDDFVGRYSVQNAMLSGVALSPAIGYAINDRISIGGGASIALTMFEQEIAINQGTDPDGKVKMEDLDDWGVQPFLGLTIAQSDRSLWGIVYRAEMDVDLSGDLEFSGLTGPVSPEGDIDVGWDNPQWLEIGFRHRVSDEWIFFANADWQDWSAFSENVLAVSVGPGGVAAGTLERNWKDTWHIGFAAARKTGDNIASFGVSYDSSAVDDADRTFDLPVDETFKLSGSWSRIHGPKLAYAFGMTVAWAGDGKISQLSQGVLATGEFDTNLIILAGGTLAYRF